MCTLSCANFGATCSSTTSWVSIRLKGITNVSKNATWSEGLSTHLIIAPNAWSCTKTHATINIPGYRALTSSTVMEPFRVGNFSEDPCLCPTLMWM